MTKLRARRVHASDRESKNMRRAIQQALAVVTFLALPLVVSAQNGAPPQTLIVNGQQSAAPLIQVKGRLYVDLEALARAAGGSVSYAGNQVALSIPGSGASSPNADASSSATPSASTPSAAPASDPGFSKGFLNSGIEAAATLREWHAALSSAIQNGYPIAAGSFGAYRAQAQTNLRLASVAATTDSDHNAYQLLNNEFQNMSKLSDRYVDRRANMTYISPDSLQNDGLNQRFITCGRSLSAMAGSGQFNDDGSCH
jgi:hypothetical protein